MKEQMYGLTKEGGRVKSAGVSIDFVFDQGAKFTSNPGPETAAGAAKIFHTLRDNPPSPIRDRFFPSDRAEIKSLTKRSPALFRPVLKTDQGAGKFLPFAIGAGNGSMPELHVALEQGYVIVEAHFDEQLRQTRYPARVMSELNAVKGHFRDRNLYDTSLAYERLQMESEQAGLLFKPQAAKVGRNGLMFIHPAKAEKPVVFPEALSQKVEEQVNAVMEELLQRAEDKKKAFASGHGLPLRETSDVELPRYFQADIHVLPNGEILVAELQVPDVGLFLAGLPLDGVEAFEDVQNIVLPLKKKVVDGLERTITEIVIQKGTVPIFLVTRPEVVDKMEDVLEIKELQEVQKALQERGYAAKIISADAASQIDTNSLLFLFNLDPSSDSFNKLSAAYLSDRRRQLIMVPTPFAIAAEHEVTGYKKANLDKRDIYNLYALVKDVELPDKPEKTYTQLMAVDHFLRQLGIEDDVIHFHHPTFPTPIPAYRHDVRGLHIASNIIIEGNLGDVEVRSVPIAPNKGVLKDIDGGTLYATFRFMFVRKG